MINYSTHHIMFDFSSNDISAKWQEICFYGWPESNLKHHFLSLLSQLSSPNLVHVLCWGDFNEILFSGEKHCGQDLMTQSISDF